MENVLLFYICKFFIRFNGSICKTYLFVHFYPLFESLLYILQYPAISIPTVHLNIKNTFISTAEAVQVPELITEIQNLE